MIDIIANSKAAGMKAYAFALGAAKTTNGRNAMLMGGANMGLQWGRSRRDDRPFGVYGAAKSFALGAAGGYYGGIALRAGNQMGWRGGPRGLMMGMQREFRGYGTRSGRNHAIGLRNMRNLFY